MDEFTREAEAFTLEYGREHTPPAPLPVKPRPPGVAPPGAKVCRAGLHWFVGRRCEGCAREGGRRRYAANPDTRREYKRRWRAANREKYRAQRRRRRLAYPERGLFKGAYERARAKRLPFSLTPSDVVIPAVCAACGVEMVRGAGRMIRRSPTLDRIIPALGYVPGNVRVICSGCNRRKGDHTAESAAALVIDLAATLGAEDRTRLLARLTSALSPQVSP